MNFYFGKYLNFKHKLACLEVFNHVEPKDIISRIKFKGNNKLGKMLVTVIILMACEYLNM